MTEYTTLSIRKGTAKRFNDLKNEHKERSSDEFITDLLDAWTNEGVHEIEDDELRLSMSGFSESQLEAFHEAFSKGEVTPETILGNGDSINLDKLTREIRKAQELAEEARDNTEDIKGAIR